MPSRSGKKYYIGPMEKDHVRICPSIDFQEIPSRTVRRGIFLTGSALTREICTTLLESLEADALTARIFSSPIT
jgi:hypothetical protein